MQANSVVFLTGADCAPVIEAIINHGERFGFDLLCKYPRIRKPFLNHMRTVRNEFVFCTGEFRMIWAMSPRYVTLERFDNENANKRRFT